MNTNMNTNYSPAYNHDVGYNTTNHNNGNNFARGLLIGGLVGAAAALLFAPKSGRELRQDISYKAQSVGEMTKDAACDLGNKAATIVKSVGERAETVVTNVKTATQAIAEQVQDAKDETMMHTKEVIADAADNIAAASSQPQQNARIVPAPEAQLPGSIVK
ncbi:YtxH domain-containing protein [Paenibacillus sp. SC116]|uniref:YtxH domain-containing protein n=1 Tax=Paenibacillus sp. SC116 TaxID=2968986 RepID=UPI00215A58DB|nr:YtxH domain-containing protein [Paenibacillus sp. SC116]MCR8846304.1 YtxH domain-containing protein [Paenibacillus sp. SC116]